MKNSLLSSTDLRQISSLGITEEQVTSQINMFKTGSRPVKLVKPATVDDGIKGSMILENFNFGAEEPIKTYIEYTKENLQLLKDYIDSQELYPEIWESWDYPSTDSASNFLYGEGHYHNEHTVNNTRMFFEI